MTEEEGKIESAVKEVLGSWAVDDVVESTFSSMLMDTEKDQQSKIECERNALRQLFTQYNEASQTVACKFFCEHTLRQDNANKTQDLLDHFEYLVRNNFVSPKPICEALLGCNELTYDALQTWCSIFRLVRKIIGGVHYKGCRDIFRVILDKCRMIPSTASSRSSVQIRCVLEVVEYILNRNACLLPSYFAINEIIKLSTHDGKPPVHWMFGKIFLEFTQSFRPTVQIVSNSVMSSHRPVIGHSNFNAWVWRLDPRDLRFPFSGPLPYDRDKPPSGLIRYVLTHAHSVDFLISSFKFTANTRKDGKQRSSELEEQLVDHIVYLMEFQTKNPQHDCSSPHIKQRWQNVTAHMIFFVLWQMVNFPTMLYTLYKKVEGKGFHKSCVRDHLMWTLLQFISGVNNRPSNMYQYGYVSKIYDQLYPDASQELSVPDSNHPHYTHSMAVSSICIHMQKKNAGSQAVAGADQRPKLPQAIPHNMNAHLQFLSNMNAKGNPLKDFQLAAMCNAYSTNDTQMGLLMNQLMEYIQVTSTQSVLAYGVPCYGPLEPLPVIFLDSLSLHVKILLIQQLFGQVSNAAKATGNPVALSPALVETVARLLNYSEMEQTCGIKAFVSTLIPGVFSAKSFPMMHTVLEIASHRRSHMQPHHRMTILSQLLEDLPSITHNQLHLRCESTAVSLLLSLGNVEVQQQVYRSITEKKFTIVSNDSEQLNRILVLTLARAINAVSDSGQAGHWCRNVLRKIFDQTPHTWSKYTLELFPKVIQEFYEGNAPPADERSMTSARIEQEFTRWRNCMNENDYLTMYSRQGTDKPYFLCVMWKCLMNGLPIHPAATKVLDFIGPKHLTIHMRVFADYLTAQLSACNNRTEFVKMTDVTNSMVVKYNFFTLDRFFLCLSLRPFEQKEAQVCLFAIQMIMLKPSFVDVMNDFTRTMSADYWTCPNYHEQHVHFHQKHPEKFFYEGIREANSIPSLSTNSMNHALPSYFDNICLRMLPVLDIIIHRLIETQKYGPTVEKALFTLLENMTPLYKFHDQPVTYLYNTLHFYNTTLSDKSEIKRKLVSTILGPSTRISLDLIISTELKAYILAQDSQTWSPPDDYFYKRVYRFVNIMSEEASCDLMDIDWRFSEFTSAPAFVLYSTCLELQTIPVAAANVATSLLDLIFKWSTHIPSHRAHEWMNAVALLLTALPQNYWKEIYNKLIFELKNCEYLNLSGRPAIDAFEVFDYLKSSHSNREQHCSTLLTLCHVIWHHSSIGQLSYLPEFIQKQVKPLVKTEQQFLYICHLVGPFLQRFQHERAPCCVELTVELYEMLQRVDHAGAELIHMDPICDFFYHIKYMFVGDEPKDTVEKIIKTLRLPLQLRLRFIAHHTTGDTATSTTTPH